ncbi:hypothetical protein WSM22_01580 [Cytophagales bacterium WSM2-2]|nr:hypothetical protein WSM22_01580 [Cytophagales bacterium WSM2-2]
MKGIPDMRLYLSFIFLLVVFASEAQLKQTSIVHSAIPGKKHKAARIQSLKPVELPFWDDFSFNNPYHVDSVARFANDSLWQYGHSVWVNNGMAINPPSLNVATFDGLDSLGGPYSVNLPLAKGVADKLTSRPLRMDNIAPSLRSNVYISFFYQYQGNGEAPDPNDEFSLWLKNDSSVWVKVWYDSAYSGDRTKFIKVKVPITDSRYFHGNFQFRFQNFARLSGPFDTWNLDYVYVSNGKTQYAPQYADIPDRAIATPLTTVFQQYFAIPVKHLLSKGDSLLDLPSLTLTNQRIDQTVAANYPQPTNLIARLVTATRLNKVVTKNSSLLDSIPAVEIFNDHSTKVTLNKLPSFLSLDPKVDSIGLKFQFKLNSGDNVKKINSNIGDFDTLVYKGLDFRKNDTISTSFSLSKYYAYDDGGAEYAVSLTQPGTFLAYQYDMLYRKVDTLVALDIYFPHVGDESNQIIQLIVYDNQVLDTTVTKARTLTQQDYTVQRTENNKFVRVRLGQPVLVKNKFFIGYKQNSTATIGVGFDKNSDSGSKLFYNTVGVWQKNSDLHGNLMMRPVFGNGQVNTVTEITEERLFAYPNPNRGIFYLDGVVQNLQVVDVTGKQISFLQEGSFDRSQITLGSPSTGLYIVRYFNGLKWRTEKIMVLP